MLISRDPVVIATWIYGGSQWPWLMLRYRRDKLCTHMCWEMLLCALCPNKAGIHGAGAKARSPLCFVEALSDGNAEIGGLVSQGNWSQPSLDAKAPKKMCSFSEFYPFFLIIKFNRILLSLCHLYTPLSGLNTVLLCLLDPVGQQVGFSIRC